MHGERAEDVALLRHPADAEIVNAGIVAGDEGVGAAKGPLHTQHGVGAGIDWWRTAGTKPQIVEEIGGLLESFHLADAANERTAMLPYGKQRLLEIAVAIAAKPRVLLLDEPAAGVPESERHDILAAVASLPRDVTVLLIEHDMDLVFSFADRISVLVNGALLVEGPPDEVARDPRVKAVYLGEAADA